MRSHNPPLLLFFFFFFLFLRDPQLFLPGQPAALLPVVASPAHTHIPPFPINQPPISPSPLLQPFPAATTHSSSSTASTSLQLFLLTNNRLWIPASRRSPPQLQRILSNPRQLLSRGQPSAASLSVTSKRRLHPHNYSFPDQPAAAPSPRPTGSSSIPSTSRCESPRDQPATAPPSQQQLLLQLQQSSSSRPTGATDSNRTSRSFLLVTSSCSPFLETGCCSRHSILPRRQLPPRPAVSFSHFVLALAS